MKILILSDTHIGNGYACRRDALADTSRVLDQIAEHATNCDLALHAGDVFHRAKPTPAELHVFKRFTQQLQAARVPMIVLTGNGLHSAPAGEKSAEELFASDWVHVSRRAEIIDQWAGVSVVTLPAVPLGRLIAEGSTDRGESSELAVDLLLRTARELFEACDPEKPRILLGHWPVSGNSLPTGLPVESLSGPVLPLDAVVEIGFDLAAFGDIHVAKVLGDAKALSVGSPMTMNFGEAEREHGVWIVDITREPGSPWPTIVYNHVPLEDRRFVSVEVDLTEEVSEPEEALSLGLDQPLSREKQCDDHSGSLTSLDETDRRNPHCILTWPECWPGEYDPRCCRFPKSCSCVDYGRTLDETDRIAAAIIAQGNGQLKDSVLRVRYTATEEQHKRVDTKALDRLIQAAEIHKLHGGYQWQAVRESRARVELTDDQGPLEMLDLWVAANKIGSVEASALRGVTERLIGGLA